MDVIQYGGMFMCLVCLYFLVVIQFFVIVVEGCFNYFGVIWACYICVEDGCDGCSLQFDVVIVCEYFGVVQDWGENFDVVVLFCLVMFKVVDDMLLIVRIFMFDVFLDY